LSPSARQPGPGGTLFVELEGMGVTIQLLPSAGAVRIVQHGGDWDGQHSGFLFVPERDFAMTILTDSDGGTKRLNDFFVNDWALSRFAGMHNLPAHPERLSPDPLTEYTGEDVGITIEQNGQEITSATRLTVSAGRLQLRHLNTGRNAGPAASRSTRYPRLLQERGRPASGWRKPPHRPSGQLRPGCHRSGDLAPVWRTAQPTTGHLVDRRV